MSPYPTDKNSIINGVHCGGDRVERDSFCLRHIRRLQNASITMRLF
jgi:hypothetical protein